MQKIINYCLGNKDFTPNDDFILVSKNKQAEPSIGGMFKGLFSSGAFKKVAELTSNSGEELKSAIYAKIPQILVSCLQCWNELPIFLPKEFFLMRSGILPYTNDDDRQISLMVEKSGIKDFKEYVSSRVNTIQEYILELLQPFCSESAC